MLFFYVIYNTHCIIWLFYFYPNSNKDLVMKKKRVKEIKKYISRKIITSKSKNILNHKQQPNKNVTVNHSTNLKVEDVDLSIVSTNKEASSNKIV